ncbi:PASTA domain-containing protein [Telmatobacter bradus]|uniref:PASTA domain-containing protein n=1 Tax=Telmatobacter bradus TaxID=474953 RepID=UPI003B431BD9
MNVRSIANFFQVAFLLLLLAVVGLLAAITTMHFAIHGAEVQVPSLKGMTVADARTQTAGLGLNLNVDNRYYSGDVAAGHILTQSPDPGTVVRREWQVRVSESLGPQKVDVPDTVGRDERVAELEIRQAGLQVGNSVRMPTSRALPGTILAQDPPAHAQDIANPTVNLLVAAANDEAADGYVMPDLVGSYGPSAVAALQKLGIKSTTASAGVSVGHVGTGNDPIRPPVPPGAVMAQSPLAGLRIDQSTQVRLTIAR